MCRPFVGRGGGAFDYVSEYACAFVRDSESERLHLHASDARLANRTSVQPENEELPQSSSQTKHTSGYHVNLNLPDTVHGHRREVNHRRLWNKYALPLP